MANNEQPSFSTPDGHWYYDAQPFDPFKGLESSEHIKTTAEYYYFLQEARAFQFYQAIGSAIDRYYAAAPDVQYKVSQEGLAYYQVWHHTLDYDPEPGNTEKRRAIMLGDIRGFTVAEGSKHLSIVPFVHVFTMEGVERNGPPVFTSCRFDLSALWEGVQGNGKDAYSVIAARPNYKSLNARQGEQDLYIGLLTKVAEPLGVPTTIQNEFGLSLSGRTLN